MIQHLERLKAALTVRIHRIGDDMASGEHRRASTLVGSPLQARFMLNLPLCILHGSLIS